MKQLTFYLDVVSPYSYLAFERLPVALEGCSYAVRYQPVLFAGMLQHFGQLGPAEIEPKRAWTYRQVAWQSHRLQIPLRMPAGHPFNPLPLLRLALACAEEGGLPNRRTCEMLFRHVWTTGEAADDGARLAALAAELAPRRDPASEAVKRELRVATEEAARRGVFGVPTIEVDDWLFWGLDALDMVAAYLRGDPWFDGPAWDEAARLPVATARRPSRDPAA